MTRGETGEEALFQERQDLPRPDGLLSHQVARQEAGHDYVVEAGLPRLVLRALSGTAPQHMSPGLATGREFGGAK